MESNSKLISNYFLVNLGEKEKKKARRNKDGTKNAEKRGKKGQFFTLS